VSPTDTAINTLSSRRWTSLPTSSLGIGTLKPRLSTVLRDQIVSEMPNLVRDVEISIEKCRNRLAKLEDVREIPQEQRLYLIHISQSFSSLIKTAVDGVYVHNFFGDATIKAGYSKRFRAVIQNFLINFAEDMRREKYNQNIIEDGIELADGNISRRISRSEFIEDVRELMRRSRECELAGTFNPLIMGDLFYRQSRLWKRLVERYCENILKAVKFYLELILIHTIDEIIRDELFREIIEPAINRITKELGMKISEIMRFHQKYYPITYNYYFAETIQKARQEYEKKNIIQLLSIFFKFKFQTIFSYILFQIFNTADFLNALI
jgi:hypothetical protein